MLYRDRVVEVFRVGAIDGNARELPEILAFTGALRAAETVSSSTLWERSRARCLRRRKRLVDVARVIRGTQDLRTSPRRERPFSRTRTRTMSPASAPRLSLRATRTGRRSRRTGDPRRILTRRTSWAGRITAREKVEASGQTPFESTTGAGRSAGSCSRELWAGAATRRSYGAVPALLRPARTSPRRLCASPRPRRARRRRVARPRRTSLPPGCSS